jgi:hypothetical protein
MSQSIDPEITRIESLRNGPQFIHDVTDPETSELALYEYYNGLTVNVVKTKITRKPEVLKCEYEYLDDWTHENRSSYVYLVNDWSECPDNINPCEHDDDGVHLSHLEKFWKENIKNNTGLKRLTILSRFSQELEIEDMLFPDSLEYLRFQCVDMIDSGTIIHLLEKGTSIVIDYCEDIDYITNLDKSKGTITFTDPKEYKKYLELYEQY